MANARPMTPAQTRRYVAELAKAGLEVREVLILPTGGVRLIYGDDPAGRGAGDWDDI